MTNELEARIKQTLIDGQQLLWHWQTTINNCPDCQKLQDETSPYLKSLTNLIAELEKKG